MQIVKSNLEYICNNDCKQPTNIDNEVMEQFEDLIVAYDLREWEIGKIRKALTTPSKSAKEIIEKVDIEFDITGIWYWVGAIKNNSCKLHCEDLLKFTQKLIDGFKELKELEEK